MKTSTPFFDLQAQRHDVFGDVAQRQIGDGALLQISNRFETRHDRVQHRVPAAMRDLDALRFPGRARRVAQHHQIVRLRGVDACRQLGGVARLAQRQELLPRQRPLRIAFGHIVHDHDLLDVLQVRAFGGELLVLLRGVGDDDLGLAVVGDPGDLLGGVGHVDRRRHRAGREDPQIGDQPLRPVVRDDGDRVALVHAQSDQRLADAVHRVPVLRPRPRGQRVGFAAVKGGLVRGRRGPLLQVRDHRVGLTHVVTPGSRFERPVPPEPSECGKGELAERDDVWRAHGAAGLHGP